MILAASSLEEQRAALQPHHGVFPGPEEDRGLHTGDKGRGGGVVVVADSQEDLVVVVGVQHGVKLGTGNLD